MLFHIFLFKRFPQVPIQTHMSCRITQVLRKPEIPAATAKGFETGTLSVELKYCSTSTNKCGIRGGGGGVLGNGRDGGGGEGVGGGGGGSGGELGGDDGGGPGQGVDGGGGDGLGEGGLGDNGGIGGLKGGCIGGNVGGCGDLGEGTSGGNGGDEGDDGGGGGRIHSLGHAQSPGGVQLVGKPVFVLKYVRHINCPSRRFR
mmetsp:Transcript_53118/g.88179  ORF Transcript_53118/g.88179 Transcript_53118/m.88179 type:complete len:201 (-) Transcript_53118:84-686(-)